MWTSINLEFTLYIFEPVININYWIMLKNKSVVGNKYIFTLLVYRLLHVPK